MNQVSFLKTPAQESQNHPCRVAERVVCALLTAMACIIDSPKYLYSSRGLAGPVACILKQIIECVVTSILDCSVAVFGVVCVREVILAT